MKVDKKFIIITLASALSIATIIGLLIIVILTKVAENKIVNSDHSDETTTSCVNKS